MKSEVCPLGLAFWKLLVVVVVEEQELDWGKFMRGWKETYWRPRVERTLERWFVTKVAEKWSVGWGKRGFRRGMFKDGRNNSMFER